MELANCSTYATYIAILNSHTHTTHARTHAIAVVKEQDRALQLLRWAW